MASSDNNAIPTGSNLRTSAVTSRAVASSDASNQPMSSFAKDKLWLSSKIDAAEKTTKTLLSKPIEDLKSLYQSAMAFFGFQMFMRSNQDAVAREKEEQDQDQQDYAAWMARKEAMAAAQRKKEESQPA